MMSSCRRVAVLSLAVCLVAASAGAITIPGVDRPTKKERREQRDKGYWETFWPKTKETAEDFVGGLALSFDYHYVEQNLIANAPAFPVFGTFTARTELNTYSLRPEIVWTNWLSTYAIVGWHEGSNSSPGFSIDLDGWAAGAGVTGALGLPEYYPNDEAFTIDPLFVLPDFNWTYNEFDGINNAVNVYNLTIRVGSSVRTDHVYLGLYAGPQYQASTEDLTIPSVIGPVDVHARLETPWSAVVGAFLGITFSDRERRPDLLFTAEAGAGGRQGGTFSIRYEYDFFGRIQQWMEKPS